LALKTPLSFFGVLDSRWSEKGQFVLSEHGQLPQNGREKVQKAQSQKSIPAFFAASSSFPILQGSAPGIAVQPDSADLIS
jgi:hypothetical protein